MLALIEYEIAISRFVAENFKPFSSVSIRMLFRIGRVLLLFIALVTMFKALFIFCWLIMAFMFFWFTGNYLIRIGRGVQGNVGIICLLDYEHVFIYFIKKIVVDNNRREIVEKFCRWVIAFKEGNCGKVV